MDENLKLLSEYKLSKTQLRVDMLNQFRNSHSPLSIIELKKNKKLKSVNESSLYRNLTAFEGAGLIQMVPTAGEYQSYEYIKKGKHHHHIVCNSCKSIQCLSICSVEKELTKMAKKVGFKLNGHSLELFGTCQNCLT